MAIKEIKREWSPCQLDYVKTFLLHSEKELKDLPKCCIGSKAIVSETDNEYFCTESGWKLGSELGGSGPSEVVILPETELVPVEVSPGELGMYNIVDALFENAPTAGATGKLVWGGVEYTSKITDISAMMGLPEGSYFCMGNLAVAGEVPPDVAQMNPAPDAPYVLMFLPAGMPTDAGVTYGQIVSQGITPEPPILSIVQTEGAASDGGSASAGGGLFIVKCDMEGLEMTPDGSIEGQYAVPGLIADKTYDEVLSAIAAGNNLVLDVATFMGDSSSMVRLPFFMKDSNGCYFGTYLDGMTIQVGVRASGSYSMTLNMPTD